MPLLGDAEVEDGVEEVYATVPFDKYLRAFADAFLQWVPLNNTADPGAPGDLREIVDNYYFQKDLEPIHLAVERDLDAPDKRFVDPVTGAQQTLRGVLTLWCGDSGTINRNPSMLAFFNRYIGSLPALQQPITTYRVYTRGILGAMPAVNEEFVDLGARSYSLSQCMTRYFANTAGGVTDHSIFVRADFLPGMHVLPIKDYTEHGGRHLYTEYEIIAPQPERAAQVAGERSRIHVLDPTGVPEGREEASYTNVVYNEAPYKFPGFPAWTPPLDRRNPLIRFWFVFSVPGTTVNYVPTFDEGEQPAAIRGGSRNAAGDIESILLNDANALGFGNVDEVTQAYMASKTARAAAEEPVEVGVIPAAEEGIEVGTTPEEPIGENPKKLGEMPLKEGTSAFSPLDLEPVAGGRSRKKRRTRQRARSRRRNRSKRRRGGSRRRY